MESAGATIAKQHAMESAAMDGRVCREDEAWEDNGSKLNR